MGKFAKLYELGTEQLLVVKGMSSIGHPEVVMFTEVGEVVVSITATFEPVSANDVAMQEAKASAGAYFDALTRDMIEEVRSEIVKQYQETLMVN